MGALFGLLTIIILSIMVVRIGAVALELTGLHEDVARFQAQSAFSEKESRKEEEISRDRERSGGYS